MARETVYEGPDLQQLLQQVIDERGPARIRPPERRRKGGLLGFFAKEVYVITVDESAPVATPDTLEAASAAGAEPALRVGAGGATAPTALVHGARGADKTSARQNGFTSRRAMMTTPLRALVEATEDEAELSTAAVNGHSSNGHSSNGLAARGLSNARPGDNGNGNGDATPSVRVRPESPLRHLVEPGRRSETVGAPRPAPEHHKAFREVLSEVASSLGEEPGAYRPDPGRLQPPRRPAVVRPLDLADVPRAAGAGDAPLSDPRGRAPGERTPAQLSLVGLYEQAPVAPEYPSATVPGAAAPAPDAPDATAGAGRAAALGPSPAPAAAQETVIAEPAITEPVAQETADHTPTAQEPASAVELGGPPDLDAAIVDLLRAAGFPDELLPRTAADPDRPLLEAVFASLPSPPPLPADPGGLVAVVGTAGMVRPMAQAIALAVDCPEDEVVVASPSASDRHAPAECRARTATQASALHPGWRRDKVAVVAVYAPPMGTTQSWTREVLRALRPSCVWAMVGATTKPDDVRRWVGAIGGVDALVMTDVDATATPASILSLGIPIACLDEEPATPERWAAVVAELVTKH